MKIKKFAAVVAAAAVLTVAAPMTGVLPDPLSVTVSAEELAVGASFYAGIDHDGNYNGKHSFSVGLGDAYSQMLNELDVPTTTGDAFFCTVKPDGTIKIKYECLLAGYKILSGKTLTIPNEINGYAVSEIYGEQADFQLGNCKKVIIPNTAKIIGKNAFAFCVELEEVEFSSKSQLTLIDQYAFQNCRSLKSVTIPASVETIAEGAFGNTEEEIVTDKDYTNVYSLASVNFEEGSKLKLIDQWGFDNQKALKSIALPESLEKLGYGAFMNCAALTKVEIPQNVDEIGAFAFSCAGHNPPVMNIAEISVAESNKNFKSVDGVVFTKDGKTIVACPAAKSGKYEIPADVNKIAEAAFSYCTKLTAVTIPDGVTDIPENAFTYCTSLAEVKLPSTLKTIAKWGFEATALTEINIPEGVTSIDAHAFDSTPLKNISGKTGSYAETFAKENGYEFNGDSSDKPSNPDENKPSGGSSNQPSTPDEDKPSGGSSNQPSTPDEDKPTTFNDNSSDKAADVQVIAKPNVIPKDAYFSVRLDDSSTAERVAYNCYFTYNGAEYEPTETVTVRIPVPIAMRDIADTLKVYHLQDGKYVNMSAKVEDGYLVFDTDHFSIYVVTAEDLEKENNGDESNSETSAEISETSSSSETSADSEGSENSESSSDIPNTGVVGISISLGVLAIAGAAVLVARKRK